MVLKSAKTLGSFRKPKRERETWNFTFEGEIMKKNCDFWTVGFPQPRIVITAIFFPDIVQMMNIDIQSNILEIWCDNWVKIFEGESPPEN